MEKMSHCVYVELHTVSKSCLLVTTYKTAYNV